MCQVAMVKKLALIFCFVGMFQTAWSQQIEIQGGGIVIAGDGTNVPVISEDTFFDTTPVSASAAPDIANRPSGPHVVETQNSRCGIR